MDTQQALQQAFQFINSGNLSAAAPLFEHVLRLEPGNFAALNGRGFVALQQNRLPQSLADFQQSLAINAQQPFAQKMLGIVLGAMGHFDASMQAFAVALALDSKDPEVYFNRANLRFQAGQAKEALEDLDTAIKLRGSYMEARYNRANLLLQSGDFAGAEIDLDYLVTKVTNNPDLWVALGLTKHKAGKQSEAMACNERALKLIPNHPDALLNSSSATYDQGEYTTALEWAYKAISATPMRAEAHYARAQALMSISRFDEALAAYSQAVALKPDYADAWVGKGLVEMRLLSHQSSIESIRSAIRINPEDPASWLNLGMAYAELGEYVDAIDAYVKSISFDPLSSKTYNNLALVYTMTRQYGMALDAYARSLDLDPESVAAEYNRSLTYLAMGNFEEGWASYESRYRKSNHPRTFDKPLWLGKEDISSRTILLHAEQGLGDTLQFCRYVNLVAKMCKQVILLVPASLKRICQTLTSNPLVIDDSGRIPAFDVHCPLMSLPFALGTVVDTIPNQIPYLYTDPSKSDYWKDKIASVKGLKVGIVWASGYQRNPDDLDGSNAGRNISLSRRNIDLAKMLTLGVPGVSFISLQKGKSAEASLQKLKKESDISFEVSDFVNELNDFADTAALIDALDLVITVDTAVAHLSAALGKETWILNRFDSCWRWIPHGKFDSPWYPSAKVYHQPQPNDWDSVLDQVRSDLQKKVSQR